MSHSVYGHHRGSTESSRCIKRRLDKWRIRVQLPGRRVERGQRACARRAAGGAALVLQMPYVGEVMDAKEVGDRGRGHRCWLQPRHVGTNWLAAQAAALTRQQRSAEGILLVVSCIMVV